MSIIKEKAKNKIHENIIGKIIYGFLLFAPLLMILTTSCYAIFNKNANESYYGESINEVITNQLESSLKPNIEYTTNLKNFTTPMTDTINAITVRDFKLIACSNSSFSLGEIVKFRLWSNAYNCNITFTNDQNQDTSFSYISNLNATPNYNAYIEFSYYVDNEQDNFNQAIKEKTTYLTYNKYSYLDNNFEYGIYKTEGCQYFNWSKTTALYTGLRTTCQNLGIENTFTPMLMAYWLLISIIYFIFDIGLIMVHIVHRKIHEFTESV